MDQTTIQRTHYANGSLKVSKLSLTINFKLFTSNKKAEEKEPYNLFFAGS